MMADCKALSGLSGSWVLVPETVLLCPEMFPLPSKNTIVCVTFAHDSVSRAITTVVQQLLSLGKSRLRAMRILRLKRCPRVIGQ